jgi:hypothetical protein
MKARCSREQEMHLCFGLALRYRAGQLCRHPRRLTRVASTIQRCERACPIRFRDQRHHLAFSNKRERCPSACHPVDPPVLRLLSAPTVFLLPP